MYGVNVKKECLIEFIIISITFITPGSYDNYLNSKN